jgi:hypothetical protein
MAFSGGQTAAKCLFEPPPLAGIHVVIHLTNTICLAPLLGSS